MIARVFAGFRQLRVQPINLFIRTLSVAAFSFSRKPVDAIQSPLSPKILPLQNYFAQFSTAPQIPIFTYKEVKDLPNHPEKLLIDVREPSELKETGQIPTSINIPLANVAQELSPDNKSHIFKTKYGRDKPTENTEIIFHCRIGKRSGQAAELAANMGYKNVKNYEGSWLEWADKEGLPK